MISLDEGTVSAGQERGGLCTGQASRCSILQHPVAGYPYSVQQMATNHFASFRRSSLPTSLGGPLTQTTADMLAEHLGPRRFFATASAPADARLHRWPQAGAQVNAPDSNCCGNSQNTTPSASLPYCNGHSNAGIEPMPAADAPAFISLQQVAHTPRDPLPGLTIPPQRRQVGSASGTSVGLAADPPFEPDQYCQQILASSGPDATPLTANRLSSTLAAAAAAAPVQRTGVRGRALRALHSYPSVAPPESQAGARPNLLQGLPKVLLHPSAAPKGPSAPAPAPGQLPAGWPLQGDERLEVASLPAFRSLSAGSVARGQGPNNGHAHQQHPAFAPESGALITAPDVDSNASKGNDSVERVDAGRLPEVEEDWGGAVAVHTPTDGSSGPRTAAGLPPPVTVQVASRSRRNGDGGNAASGRGRLTRGAIGLFHPELYLKGAECIECGSEMMSRGRFERLAGTATAKWHVSIKVLPSGMTLGKWLQQHGLPILQGRPRKRRADHQDEGANEEGEENSSLLPGFCRSTFNPLASLWLPGAHDAAAAAAALAAASGVAAAHMLSQATTTTAAGAEGGAHPVAAAWSHQTATEREVNGAATGPCASEAEDDPLATLFECPEILDVLEAGDTPEPVQDARAPAPGKPRFLPPGRTLLPGNRPPGATTTAPGLVSSGNGQDSFSRPAVSPETAVGSQAMGMTWSGMALGSVGAGVGSPPGAAMPAVDSLSPVEFPARQSGTSVSSIQTMGSGAASGGSLPMAGWHDGAATPQVDSAGQGCWGVAWHEQGATAAAAPLVPASAEAGLGASNQVSHFHFLSLDAHQTDSRLSTSGGASLAHPALDGVSDRRSDAQGVVAVAPAYHRLAPQNGTETDWLCSGSYMSPGNSTQNSCVSLLGPWGLAGPSQHARSHGVLGAGGAPSSSAPIPRPHVHCLMAPGPAAPQAVGNLLCTTGVAVNGGGGGVATSASGSGLLLQLEPQMVPRGCSQYHVFTSQEQQQQSTAASWGHPQMQAHVAQGPSGAWLAPQSV